MIDQRIFEDLQTKIDEETTVRDVRAPISAPCAALKFFARQAELSSPAAHNNQLADNEE